MHTALLRSLALALVVLLLPACGSSDGAGTTPPTMAGPFVSPPNDPLYGRQWHLNNPGNGMFVMGEDVRAQNAWAMMTGAPAEPVTGRGVRLVVIDDGVHLAHEDFAGNILMAAGGWYNPMGVLGGTDPTPPIGMNPDLDHGTGVAGTAAAVGHNGIGVSGVAPRASLVGISQGGTVIADTTAMIKDVTQNHIYNMSYGPGENGYYTLTQTMERDAITTGLNMGRGGRGAIYLRAGGNGGEPTGAGSAGSGQPWRWGHHSNLDGFNNEWGVIVVGLTNGAGTSPIFNQCGACVTLCAPAENLDMPAGPPTPQDQVVTTSIQGANGANVNTWYSSMFNATSAACPEVAGVVALILQVNPNLTWRDVRRILAHSARRNDPGNAGWAQNNGGAGMNARFVHHKYGYGVADAGAAVMMAQGFTTLGAANIAPTTTATTMVNMAIADNMPAGGVASMMMVAGAPMSVDQVVVKLNLNTPNLRDHKVVLTSPMGTQSTLLEPNALKRGPIPAGSSQMDNPSMVALNGDIRLCTVRLMGENPNGMWTLTVTDEVGAAAGGTFVSWAMDIYAD